jgi:hypothetical protein
MVPSVVRWLPAVWLVERRAGKEATVRRFLTVGLAVIAMLTVIASPATAMRPDRFTPGPNPDLQVDDICSFPVLLHDVVNKLHITDFFDRNGDLVRESGNGRIVEDITRLDAAGDPVRTIRRNISGPGTFTFDEDGFTLRARGGWLFFFGPGEVSNVPGGLMWLTTGRFVWRFDDASGMWTLEQARGTRVDVCALLA